MVMSGALRLLIVGHLIGLLASLMPAALAAPVGTPPGNGRVIGAGQVPRECTSSDSPFNEWGMTTGYFWSEKSQTWVGAPYCYARWGLMHASASQIAGAGDTVTVTAIPDDGRIPGLIAIKGGMQWNYPGTLVSGCGTTDMQCTVRIGNADSPPAEWAWHEFHVSGPGRVFILPPSYGRCPEADPCLDTRTNAWSYVGLTPEYVTPTLDLSIASATSQPDVVKPGETIHYTLTASGMRPRPTKALTISARVPAYTQPVPNTFGSGKLKGSTLEWRFSGQSSATVRFDATVNMEEKLPGNAGEVRLLATAVSQGPGGNVSATDDDKVAIDRLSFDVVDADPSETFGLFFPSREAMHSLPKFGSTPLRQVNGVAADGVALLLLRADTQLAKHGRIRFSVEDPELGAPTGSLWAADDTALIDNLLPGGNRDTMPAGPDSLAVETFPHPQDSRRSIAYALYRSPRNFDHGLATFSRQTRPIKLKAELLYTGDGQVLQTKSVDMEVVRPLVILQHGTFDSPDGWNTSELFLSTGNELVDYAGATGQYPFQTHRGNFNTYKGAAGDLLGSAPVAWQAIGAGLENWRRVTGYAGAQVDVVAHSYGGVNMRWIAQSQAELTNPLALDATTNFRNAGNWGHGLFHKLITIATTHRGSAVSNQLADLNRNGRKAGIIAAAAESQSSWINRGAVEDQMVVSPRLRMLGRTRVPGHVIAGSGLCEFNANYDDRLYMLWFADAADGPFRSLGAARTNGVRDWSVYRAMSNYGFNLGQELMDDTSQDPNYDLTVSSWSSKAGMPLAAQSTVSDLEGQVGLGAGQLVGRVTHGDEIADGSGDRRPVDAVSQRVAFLLRQPTDSDYFKFFPGFFEVPLTPTEEEFSNTQRFNPDWLYISVTNPGTQGIRTLAASEPSLSANVSGTTVVPGQVLQVSVTPSAAGLEAGILTWSTMRAGVPEIRSLDAGTTTVAVTVPNRRPGPFSLAAILQTPGGDVEHASLDLEIVDPNAYSELQALPKALILRDQRTVAIDVRGKLGEVWRDLGDSPRLVLTSSNPAVVEITSENRLQPGAPGAAIVTASYDGGLSTTVPVTVEGFKVGALAVPRGRGKVRAQQRTFADFVFLSGNRFDPAKIDGATVVIGGLAPRSCKPVKDANGDGVKELACYVKPMDLGLQKGAALVSMHAMADGIRVTGQAAVMVK